MASAPRLLLLDEPAAGLNGEERSQLAAIVRSIRDSGVTVVLIEHNMGLVMSLCERVIVLDSGTVIAEGLPAAGGHATPRSSRPTWASPRCPHRRHRRRTEAP